MIFRAGHASFSASPRFRKGVSDGVVISRAGSISSSSLLNTGEGSAVPLCNTEALPSKDLQSWFPELGTRRFPRHRVSEKGCQVEKLSAVLVQSPLLLILILNRGQLCWECNTEGLPCKDDAKRVRCYAQLCWSLISSSTHISQLFCRTRGTLTAPPTTSAPVWDVLFFSPAYKYYLFFLQPKQQEWRER